MPFLGTEQSSSMDFDTHAATKALKKALKLKNKMAQQNGDMAEQSNIEKGMGDDATEGIACSLSRLLVQF